MALFLIVSVPFWYLLVVSLYKTPVRGWRALFIPFLGGLLIGMAAIIITLGLLTRTPFGMNLPELFRWAWFRGPGWPLLLVVPVLLFRYLRKPTSFSRIREISGWLSGTAFIYTFWYTLTPDPGFDFYRVFFMPLFWIGCIASIAWLVDRGLRIEGWLRYLLFAAALGASSLFTFLPVIYSMGEVFYAFLIAFLLVLASGFLIFLDSRGQLN